MGPSNNNETITIEEIVSYNDSTDVIVGGGNLESSRIKIHEKNRV